MQRHARCVLGTYHFAGLRVAMFMTTPSKQPHSGQPRFRSVPTKSCMQTRGFTCCFTVLDSDS
eukprot:10372702-Alexandrium_andersonii.AAC.1